MPPILKEDTTLTARIVAIDRQVITNLTVSCHPALVKEASNFATVTKLSMSCHKAVDKPFPAVSKSNIKINNINNNIWAGIFISQSNIKQFPTTLLS